MTQAKSHTTRKIIITLIKLLIAVVGLWYVISHIAWNDQVVVKKGAVIRNVTFIRNTRLTLLAHHGNLYTLKFKDQTISVRLPHGQVATAIATKVPIEFPDLLAVPANYLVGVHDKPAVALGFPHLLDHAKPLPLLAALLLLGLPFVITAWRWRQLMLVQGMNLPYGKCLTLTFVGQFYSTFLPGTTSGDIVKIIYTGRITGQKTKSAVTVILDRVIGLIGLMLVAGVAAAAQLTANHFSAEGQNVSDPVLVHVLSLIAGLLGLTIAGGIVYFSVRLRKLLRVDALLERLPLPEFLKHADRTLRVYRDHPGVIALTLGASVLSQAVLPLAGFLAGRAFGMHASFGCFMAYIPVAALAASLPIVPPQGIGVMDAILLHFFVTRGVDTASQAFALAQAIRFLPICWNMLGAYWVVRGAYHRQPVESLAELPSEA
ncbi:MAG: lysylphosphatidylglycerol synthase transmembrane domain-containing protein [Phycisphaerae bacterium]